MRPSATAAAMPATTKMRGLRLDALAGTVTFW